jgi:hypothetical protein
MEFNDQTTTNVIKDKFVELGAGSPCVMAFPRNDGDKTAASALQRVLSLSKSDGYIEVVRGECNAKLLKKANELAEADAAAAELHHEFSEKTQAAIQLSLEDLSQTTTQIVSGVSEITVQMATKEGLFLQQLHLEKITDNLAASAQYQENTTDRQKFIIGRLNQDRDELIYEVSKLKDENFKLVTDHCLALHVRDERHNAIERQKDFVIYEKDLGLTKKDAVIEQKDAIIEQKDGLIQQKDEDYKKLAQENRVLLSQLSALRLTVVNLKRKEPEPHC